MQTKANKITNIFNEDCLYFSDGDFGPKEMTGRQKQTLTELIYARISDPEAVEDRLHEMEDFTYEEAKRAISEFARMKWQ